MRVTRQIRAALVGLCFALLVFPAMRTYRTPPEWTVPGVLRTIFPALLVLFGMLCIREGEDRERARAEQERVEREGR
jgi:hypothetical protein